MRNLTISEQTVILESAKVCKRDNLNFDLNQDFSVRYNLKGYSYYEVVKIDTLHSVLFPIDAHICNVIGNMNYTEAYNKQ